MALPAFLTRPIHAEAKLTGYTPTDAPGEGGALDMHDRPLQTLQEMRGGLCEKCAVAMDFLCAVPYGQLIEIPRLADGPVFYRADTGSHFLGLGLTALDVCCSPGFEFAQEVNELSPIVVRMDLPPYTPPD
jgi:hypothetical protein